MLVLLGVAIAAMALSPTRFLVRSSAQPQDQAGSKQATLHKNFDVRVNGTGPTARLARIGTPAIAGRAQAHWLAVQKGVARLKAKVPTADARLSPMTGAVEVLGSSTSLSGPQPGRSGEEIVRGFIENNRDLYGLSQQDIQDLNFIGESVSPGSGLRMVRVEQIVNGLPIFQSETRVVLDRAGRLIQFTGLIIPQAGANAPALGNLISAEEALQSSMAAVDIPLNAGQMTLAERNTDGTKVEVVANNDRILGNVPSKLVYFPLAPGVLVPAWSQIIFSKGADWYTLVSATSGELLWRKNIRNSVSTHQARFNVYVQADGKTPADSPAPQSPTGAVTGGGTQFPEIARTIVNMLTVQNIAASPNGWINDCPAGGCTANETQTIGNNVHAYLDRTSDDTPDTNAAGVIDGNGKPTGNPDANTRNRDFLGIAPRDYTLTPPPQGGAGNPEVGQTATGAGSNGTNAFDAYRRGAITQLFYVSNWYHDQLFALGFNEAAGNFQQTNFSGMGVGGDRVLAEAQDGGDVDNANFATPPDGTSGRAQMYIFTGPTIDRDGDLDAEVLMHELSHGTSNRLIGNGAGLNWDPGAGMGEGWSDFYALSLLNNTNADDPNGKYASGAYATYKLSGLPFLDNYVYGIRRFPYSTNNSINPLTWADVDQVTNNLSGGIPTSTINFNGGGALEVHNVGEVWAMTLWEVRSRIIAANANDVPTGNNKTLQLVTDALKLTPISPSFTDARDAIVNADCAANACANEPSIWGGFADRGLGYNASAPLGISLSMNACSHMAVKESFLSPYLDVQSVAVNDALGNNNGSIDPGEAIRIFVTLKNPWRLASKGVASATATLTTATAGVNIVDNTSTYPAIAAQGSAVGDQFRFHVPPNVTCGQALKFTITVTSSIGTQAVDFVLRVGANAGNGAPITYTRTPPSPITISGATANFPGIVDSQTITDDFVINDLNFRIDSVTHTFNGDLTAMLRGPNGYGNDFVSFIDGTTDGGPGVDLVNMVIDDEAAVPNDLLITTAADSPYTGDWLPIFNSPTFLLTAFGENDPVGQLSRFDGISTQGVWSINMSDQFNQDGGSLNSWSIIVTPRAFTCTPAVPTASDSRIAGQVTEPGGGPLAGVVVNLSGTQSRKTITDANGNYAFENVETNGFYTVTPSMVSYHFSPEVRSFSQIGNNTSAVFTGNRDAVAGINLIDSPEYFVRQHYLDFLGREPDESGFNFWTDQITSCGSDAACIEQRTINVSAAYFLSIEHQNTGGLVNGLYRASYGRAPSFAEFMPDTATVAQGVIVGTMPNWQEVLLANKEAFVAAWVQRPAFQAAYGGLANGDFVDALISHTGGSFNGDREALVNGLNAGTMTRAAALQQIAENDGFVSAKRNENFVRMQYFGYLRRDPDAAGEAFWLNKLNQFNGNFEQAEMVKAFLVSGEYRARFNQ
ncbi:MAG TPA: M36 family metallopeptidase [Pyrinomonadaceae bacterium]|nr:M36 family metallopeptidase [Pyrinomonadaceae bacterium]